MLSQDVLTRAGIEEADGLTAVTNSDSVNAVVGHIARDVYKVANVVVRNYNPRWLPMHEAFGLQVVSSTAWGAQRIEELLYQPARPRRVLRGQRRGRGLRAGGARLLAGRPVGELLAGTEAVAAAFTRAAARCSRDRTSLLEPGDILHVSATLVGIEAPARAGRLRRTPLMAEARSMFVLIAGGGRTGAQLATFLVSQHHEVVVIEHRPGHPGPHPPRAAHGGGVRGQRHRPRRAGAGGHPRAQVLAACMRGDADNLALCFIARSRYRCPRTIATINNPRNAWLFDAHFHVDVAVNQAEILASLIEQEMSLGEMMTLLKLRRGRYSLVEDKDPARVAGGGSGAARPAPAAEAVIAAIIRQGEIVIPRGQVAFEAGDEVLAIVDEDEVEELAAIFGHPVSAAGEPR